MKDNPKLRPAFHTVDDVAATLAVSTRTVHRLIETGALPAHQIGRSVRISAEDLGGYLAKSRK